jgi:glucose dehydrogenase
MKLDLNEVLQWAGAVLIIAGHSLNAIGPSMYPYNIVVFALGTVAFLIWAIRAKNRPQMAVNFVSIAIGIVGLVSAFGG